jgi:hypothetical protein
MDASQWRSRARSSIRSGKFVRTANSSSNTMPNTVLRIAISP